MRFLEVLVERVATLLVSLHWRGRAVSLPVVSLLLMCYVTLVLVQALVLVPPVVTRPSLEIATLLVVYRTVMGTSRQD